jgi:mannosyltransferase
MLIAASFVTSSLWVPRYALPAVVPVALLAAVSLRGFRWQSVLALCVIAGLSVETQQAMRGETAQGGMDLRAAAGVIERNQRPGDAVVYGRVGSWSLRSGIDYELRHRSERPKDALEVRTAAQVGGLDAQECPALDCFGQQRVWYVAAHHTRDPLSDTGVRLGAKLRREYTEVQAWPISSGVVVLLRRK